MMVKFKGYKSWFELPYKYTKHIDFDYELTHIIGQTIRDILINKKYSSVIIECLDNGHLDDFTIHIDDKGNVRRTSGNGW